METILYQYVLDRPNLIKNQSKA